MNPTALTLARNALACLGAMLALAPAPPVRADGTVPGYVILRTSPGEDIDQIASSFQTAKEPTSLVTDHYCLKVPSGSTAAAFARKLNRDARVVWADTDTYTGTPELVGEPFHFAFDAGPNPGNYYNQFAYQQVDLGNALRYSSGAGVIVAVLDTGATFSHSDLQGHYLPGYNFITPGKPPADVPDGVSNAAVGHGTMIAGIIAHLAPNAMIMPLRVLSADGIGTDLNAAQALHFAVLHGARVVNMSFGSHKPCPLLNDALDEVEADGIAIVASAGNNGMLMSQFPAAYPGVISVTSAESNDLVSNFSNYGYSIAVVAPGHGIRSTYWTGGYATWSGTSFSAPFVAAEAALVLGNGQPLAEDIGLLIRSTAHPIDRFNPPMYWHKLGSGIIDIQAAVTATD